MRWMLPSLAVVSLFLCSCGKKNKPADTPDTPNPPAPSKPEVTALLCFWDATVNEHVYTYGDGEPANWRGNPAFSAKPTVGYVATKPYPDTVQLQRAYCRDRRHYFYIDKPAGATDIERVEDFRVYVWTRPGDGRVPVHACFLPDDKDPYFEQDLKRVKDYVDGTLKGIGKQRKLVENYFYVYPTGPNPSPRPKPPVTPVTPKPPTDPYLLNWWEDVPANQRPPLIVSARKASNELKKLGVEIDESFGGEGRFYATLDERFVSPEGKVLPEVLRQLRLSGVWNLRIAPKTSKGAMLTDAGVAELDQLRCVQQLSLDWSELTDAGLAGLKGLKGLHTLTIGNPGERKLRITGEGFKHLKELPALGRLELRNASITDAGLQHLPVFPRLWELDLSQNPITDAGLPTFAKCSKLTKLRLTAYPSITQAGVDRLGNLKPDLDIKTSSP